jgi:ABC-2 type transport system permease protein
MNRIFRFFIRSSSFFLKEMVEVLRQPRLILNLVLGPFLIMLLFGLGFSNEARPVQTLFVVQQDSPFGQVVSVFSQQLGETIIDRGMTSDKQNALSRLAQNEVDLVIVTPEDPMQTIQENQQAIFQVYHNEIDPTQAGYIEFVGRLYVDALNSHVLKSITEEGQGEASSLQPTLKEAEANAGMLKQAMQAGDLDSIQTNKNQLYRNLNLIQVMSQATLGVLQNIDNTFGHPEEDSDSGTGQEIVQLLQELDQSAAQISSEDSQQSSPQQIQEVEKVEDQLQRLDELLTQFQAITPDVLVNPFRSQAESITGVQLTPTDFYTPAVIVLLLQHLSVTFAALSIVRERSSGAMELFKVSPISAFETLLGKYLSYFIFGIVLAAILSGLVVWVLGIPMLGSWWDFAAIIMILVFTSLGAGFLISMISETDTQAVQNSMLLLLASIFFSGFILDLRLMTGPVRAVSWVLPATYGISMLKDVMLRGHIFAWSIMLGISGIGVGLFLINWILLQRKMASR